jgi:hypothetical protein
MPAVPFIISFAVDYAIGAAVAEAVGAEILGSTLLADAASGAIKGAVSGGISAAAQGGDVGKGVEGGAVGGAVAGAVTGQAGQPDPSMDAPLREASGVSAIAPREVARGAGSAAGILARGGSPKQAATGGLISGGIDYIAGTQTADASQTEQALTSVGKGLGAKYANELFSPAPTRSAQTEGGGGFGSTSVTTTGAGQAPGSQALSQALRIGDPGAPILGSSDKEAGDKKSGWNVESLRYMGQES